MRVFRATHPGVRKGLHRLNSTLQRSKAHRRRQQAERERRSFTHPSNHWSRDQWFDLLHAARRKRLRVELTPGGNGYVRLTPPRAAGHALCVCASVDYRELMHHLA